MLALFIIFALLLVHLYTIVQSTGEVTEADLQIPTRKPDYVLADANDPKFNLTSLFRKNTEWNRSVARDFKTHKDFSDIMEIFKISRCGHCKYLIPRRIMEESGKCPRLDCGKELLPPKKEEVGSQVAARLDSDEDGIPNIVELECNLNPYDANDALQDLDDDGFVNVYEYRQQPDLNNLEAIKNALKEPKNHPPLHKGLYITNIERQILKAELIGVSAIEGRPKETWSIQMLTKEQIIKKKKKKEERHYLNINSRIQLDTGTYTIIDITSEVVKKMIEKKMQDVTVYHVILKDRKGRKITMKMNEVAYDPDDKVFFKDVWSDTVYQGKVGNRFRMGNSTIDYTRYTIKAIDKKTNTATLAPLTKGGADIVIRTKPEIPQEFIPVKDKDKDKDKNEENANADGRANAGMPSASHR